MRQIGEPIGCLLLTALLAMPSPLRAASLLLEQAVGLPGLIMFMGSGAPGMVLAEARLSLTDPLQDHAPAGTRVPDLDGRPITLLDLATHTAALPRELPLAPPSGAAPFAWPTTADRFDWLADQKLPWAPGSVAAYSNVRLDVLGAALADAAGSSYADLLRERITDPLGMVDTAPNEEQCARLITGYSIPGAEGAPCVSTANIAASGGVYSTADDMVLWLRHNLARADPAAWPTLALTHAAYVQRQDLAAVIGFDDGVRWMPSPFLG